MATNYICGVSILRAGETMEQAVCDVCKDIRIGKILIQTNLQTGEPEVRLFYKIFFRFLIFYKFLPSFMLNIQSIILISGTNGRSIWHAY